MSDEVIAAARAKLFAKNEARIGGKGTQRRKVKAKHTAPVVADDKKLSQSLKKLGINPIPSIEEVNMFTDDNHVLHFKDPKLQASLQANTYVINGPNEKKPLQEMMPQIISQMGNDNLNTLRRILEQMPAQGADDDLGIPDVPANFEEVSKTEGSGDVEVD